MRIIVGNGSPHQRVLLFVGERNNSSLGLHQQTDFTRPRLEPPPFYAGVEEMRQRRKLKVDGAVARAFEFSVLVAVHREVEIASRR